MQIPLQMIGDGFGLSAAQEEMIRREAAGLERFYSRLTGCRVVVRVPHRYPGGEPVSYSVRLVLDVPGGQLAVSRQAKPSFGEALKDGFATARRQLQDYAREIRSELRAPEGAQTGRVGRVLAGENYGFIQTEDGREVYFHRNSVLDQGWDRLEPGVEVRFTEEMGDAGPQASSVALRGRGRHATVDPVKEETAQ